MIINITKYSIPKFLFPLTENIVPQGHYFVVPDVRQFSYYESEQELALNLIPFEKFVGRLEVVILNTKGLPIIGSGRFSDLSSLAVGKLRFLRKLNKVD